MKYRSRLDIIAMALEAVGDGSKKTKVVYDAYLSYEQLGEYLDFLLGKGLIAFEAESGLYRLTDDGRRALAFIADLEKLVGVAGRRPKAFERDDGIASQPKAFG